MLKQRLLQQLEQIKQLHLAEGVDTLSETELELFLNALSPTMFESQKEHLNNRMKRESSTSYEPYNKADIASFEWSFEGHEALSQGAVACVILAGGQGSRLGSHLPKALIPVSTDGKKTLIEFHLENIYAINTLYGVSIPCAIITSSENHAKIVHFLKSNQWFGLSESSVSVVMQSNAPFLDEEGHWFLRSPGILAMGPDGNGHAVHLLASHGLLKKWESQGIRFITIVPIDNPLANPVDPILVGYHLTHPADVTLKAIVRSSPEENVGVICLKDGKVVVQEYSEIPDEAAHHKYLAYIGLLILNLSFAQSVVSHSLPWHLAHKYDHLSQKWIWKFERFIFDMLPYADKTQLLLYPREEVYAPLKNSSGDKSLATVQAALKRVQKDSSLP
jgi:UDP-N-acetylglucosamine/UDP-N-acetylgalactosamine diphosphorylase